MSTLKSTNVQLGQSNTATQNFTLTAAASDGTMKLARGNQGATTQDVLTVDASGNLGSIDNSGLERMVLRTAVATTSGTAVDFTGIPSWAKKITVMFNGVSTNGGANYLVQLGTSGGLISTGYVSASSFITSAGNGINTPLTSGFQIASGSAANVCTGVLACLLMGGNIWVSTGVIGQPGVFVVHSAASVALGATISRMRLTTANGTDTFDAGSVNILIEG